MTTSQTTTDHQQIRQWVEERGGHPSVVRSEGKGGILRIDFGEGEEGLEQIGWEEFLSIFDDNKLAFLFQEKTADGQDSRFNKFIDRQ
ncbi:hypothetical protein ACQ3G6_10105 [Allorhizobium undicola]|uniref:hypothetical protein n=1 Tax=Allorhizobium undicola TaxID=78527 RepID=UPI0004844828|nr:hypothetical protein [Allorhizobium undicola]